MRFFSWKTQDTNRSIPSRYSTRSTFSVTMTDNKGNQWHEHDYEGYGMFGGKDFYELLAEMNNLKGREAGITLCFSKKPFKSPNLTEYREWKWIDKYPEDCEYQGYFYEEPCEICEQIECICSIIYSPNAG